MEIRLARLEDANHFVEFNKAMALETEGKILDGPLLEAAVKAVFEDPNKGFYVAAEDKGQVVGGLMVTYEWSDWRNGWWWWIQSVYIRPEARGRKIYSLLYDDVKRRAREAGDVYGIRLYVEYENELAARVYEKLGMEREHYHMYAEQL
ncbi:MAG: GNAT family N-acetyltransferase [Pyrinomonadaceae bacterium]|nr:GNAT family N-acetyltransferase [Pyrinomonadaceae bacterium]